MSWVKIWQFLEPKCRWSVIRQLAQAPIVRLTALMPVFGYLLVFTTKAQSFIADIVVPWLPTGWVDLDFGWRLFFLFYGSLSLGVGALLFSWTCPRLVKVHGSAFEFVNSEFTYHWTPFHMKELERDVKADADRLYSPATKTHQRSITELSQIREIAAATASKIQSGDPQSDIEGSKAVVVELMTMKWRVQDTECFLVRLIVMTFFVVGLTFVAIPSLITVAWITWQTLTWWLCG